MCVGTNRYGKSFGYSGGFRMIAIGLRKLKLWSTIRFGPFSRQFHIWDILRICVGYIFLEGIGQTMRPYVKVFLKVWITRGGAVSFLLSEHIQVSQLWAAFFGCGNNDQERSCRNSMGLLASNRLAIGNPPWFSQYVPIKTPIYRGNVPGHLWLEGKTNYDPAPY